MAVTQKISVAMGRDELRLARAAARKTGISLSAYVTAAVRERLAEQRRAEAARELIASFTEAELPTPDEQQRLVALWTRPPLTKAFRNRRTRRTVRRAS